MARIVVKDIPEDIKVTEEEIAMIRSDLVSVSFSPLGKIVEPVQGPSSLSSIGILMCSKTLGAETIGK